MDFPCIIGIDLATSMTALLQCGSSPSAAGSVVTSSGACETRTSPLVTPINAPKYRYDPVCNFIQTQLGFGQYRSPRDTINSGNTGRQRFGMPLGHHFPSLLEREEAKGQVLRRISTPWCNLASGCPHCVLELEYLCPTAGLLRRVPGHLHMEWRVHGRWGRSSHGV